MKRSLMFGAATALLLGGAAAVPRDAIPAAEREPAGASRDYWVIVTDSSGALADTGAVTVTAAVAVPASSGAVRAFPGAEGFGAYATGGRGGRVERVTNLNDDGPGSLRSALTAPGRRTIVFDVAGTITLERVLRIESSDFTLAGQTAPGGGVTVRGAMVRILADNFIVRHIRFRRGVAPGESGNTANDALQIGASNGILDHVSVSWGGDEVLDVGGPGTDITVQWSVISEGMNTAGHAYVFRIGGWSESMRVSVHHNVIAHGVIRLPSITYAASVPRGGLAKLVDFRNNVRYNWAQASQIRNANSPASSISVNYVGNYSLQGPNTRSQFANEAARGNPGNNAGIVRIFHRDNLINRQDLGAGAFGRMLTLVDTPFPIDPEYAVAEENAQSAYERVLAGAGATRPMRDAVDERIVREIKSGTGRIPATQDEVGGWPALAAGQTPRDSDRDGMPDAWESARGLDANDASDRNGDRDGDGYTNLEEYLNDRAAGK